MKLRIGDNSSTPKVYDNVSQGGGSARLGSRTLPWATWLNAFGVKACWRRRDANAQLQNATASPSDHHQAAVKVPAPDIFAEIDLIPGDWAADNR